MGCVFHGLDGCQLQAVNHRHKLVDGTVKINQRYMSVAARDKANHEYRKPCVNIFEEAVLQHLRELDYSF